MSSNDQFNDVTGLVADAFATLAKAVDLPQGRPAQRLEAHARMQIQAAQALATLVVSQELRAIGLLLASSTKPLGQEGVNPEATASAYTAAAVHLGLVEVPEERGTSVHEFMEDWMSNDPADKDVEA